MRPKCTNCSERHATILCPYEMIGGDVREIKFRAWFPTEYYDKPHMAYSPTNTSDDSGGRASTWDLIELLESGKPDSPIYMQYTGLKDKNGVEIYESDLLPLPEGAVTEYGWVEYFEGAFVFAAKEPRSGNALRTLLAEVLTEQSMEVVGNIYENPELLK